VAYIAVLKAILNVERRHMSFTGKINLADVGQPLLGKNIKSGDSQKTRFFTYPCGVVGFANLEKSKGDIK
jgi:hypothetical protein